MTRKPTENFDPQVKVQVIGPDGEGREWSDLDIHGEVTKTDGMEPNKGTVEMWNLNPDSHQFISTESEDRFVRVFAGFHTAALIFQGSVTKVERPNDSNEPKTVIKSGDGQKAYSQSTVSQGYEGQVSLFRKVKDAGKAMVKGEGVKGDTEVEGLSIGEKFKEVAQGKLSGLGGYLDGSASKNLEKLAGSVGGVASIQDGQIQVYLQDEDIGRPATVVSRETGMIGVPESTDRGVKCRKLLDETIQIKRLIDLRTITTELDGLYLVVKADFDFTNFDDRFEVEFEAVDSEAL